MTEPVAGDEAFGRQALRATSAAELLSLEQAAGRAEFFAATDVAIGELATRAARGEPILRLSRTKGIDHLALCDVPAGHRAALVDAFDAETQRARGAWFLPESVSVKAGSILFPALFKEAAPYAHTLAADARGKVLLAGCPDALLVWTVLSPLFDAILAPLLLRVRESGLLPKADFEERWTQANDEVREYRLSLDAELHSLRWGGDWPGFSPNERREATRGLLSAIAAQVTPDVVHRHRAVATRSLVAQYYAKAKRGSPKAKQVLTKDYARQLAGHFGGDWLRFLRYLGETPHDEERAT